MDDHDSTTQRHNRAAGELGALPENVRDDILHLDEDCRNPLAYANVRAELLRLTGELTEARETIKRLNRRVQVAEAGVAEKIKASAPGSLGRALANAAASKAESELAEIKERIASAPKVTASRLTEAGRTWVSLDARKHPGLAGHRVRLLVEDGE